MRQSGRFDKEVEDDGEEDEDEDEEEVEEAEEEEVEDCGVAALCSAGIANWSSLHVGLNGICSVTMSGMLSACAARVRNTAELSSDGTRVNEK